MRRRRFYIISNLRAGRGDVKLAEEVQVALAAAGVEVVRGTSVRETEIVSEARQAVLSGRVEAVLAAGGDGTVRLAAQAVAGTSTPLGVIPLGTGNVLAHEIGLPRDPTALAKLFLAGEVSRIFTATANGELFLLMVGVGFDARVIACLDHERKLRVGKLAYAGPVLRSLAEGSDTLRFIDDHGEERAGWIVIANAGRYGGRFMLTRTTRIDRDGLVALLFPGRSAAGRLIDLLCLAGGALDYVNGRMGPIVRRHGFERATITASVPVPVQIDGDAFGTTPVLVESGGPAVHLLTPPGRR
jgi:diacylglycerol kinase family enzyme